jgi:hypothetical protein
MNTVPDGLLLCRVRHSVANIHQLTERHFFVASGRKRERAAFSVTVDRRDAVVFPRVGPFPASVAISLLLLLLLLLLVLLLLLLLLFFFFFFFLFLMMLILFLCLFLFFGWCCSCCYCFCCFYGVSIDVILLLV